MIEDRHERYRLKQDGIPVAWSEGPGALRKIEHYALIYSQDGPVVIERHVEGRWRKLEEMMMRKHCDDYIDDETQPECLRSFLDYARSPMMHPEPRPKLFADYNGQRVRVVMASRFGDVGITGKLDAEHGYDKRVAVEDLSGFSENPAYDR